MKKLFLFVAFSVFVVTAYCQRIEKWKITDVENYMTSSADQVLVINLWATFCKPCIAEIPSFISIVEKYKNSGVKLLLVSLDLPSYYPAKINAFVKKHGFNTHITWLDETNADYFCPKVDKSWSGSIPATLIINKKTGFRKFFEEEIEPDVFETTIKQALQTSVIQGN